MRTLSFLSTFILISTSAFANTPALTNLSTAQTQAVFDTLAAYMNFTPVEPPSAYGKMFGFSAGLNVSGTSAYNLPQNTIKYLPSANLYAGLQLPMGVGLEAGYLPTVKLGESRVSRYGGGLKWNINQAFFEMFPVQFALRGSYSKGFLKMSKNMNGGTLQLDYNTRIFAAMVSAGLPLPFITPYAGLGLANELSSIKATGSVPVFAGNVTQTSEVKNNSASVWINLGAEIKFSVLTFSLEYDRLFQNDVFNAKLGLKI